MNFEVAEFWFVKGYDHCAQNQWESGLDSYRQCIRVVRERYNKFIRTKGSILLSSIWRYVMRNFKNSPRP